MLKPLFALPTNPFRSMLSPLVLLCAVSLGMTALATGLAGCVGGSDRSSNASVKAEGLARFQAALVGSYSSQKQSEQDKDYFDIRLRIVPIWTDRTDGPWLYVEQATAAALDKPYRQRVYRLSHVSGNTYRSDVYLLPEPALNYAGAWRNQALFGKLTPERLDLKGGCGVVMTYDPATGTFTGGTQGNGCESTLRGAAYATSEVTMTNDLLVSWDRGYDAAGKQMWGAEKGGYRFDKISRDPAAE